MDIEEFVRLTLIQIGNGVSKAKKELMVSQPQMLIAMPVMVDESGKKYSGTRTGRQQVEVAEVQFDLAVHTKQSKGKDGGGSIGIASVGIGGKLHSGSEDSSISRVSFSVPWVWNYLGDRPGDGK